MREFVAARLMSEWERLDDAITNGRPPYAQHRQFWPFTVEEFARRPWQVSA
jgi:hypothetical protein